MRVTPDGTAGRDGMAGVFPIVDNVFDCSLGEREIDNKEIEVSGSSVFVVIGDLSPSLG